MFGFLAPLVKPVLGAVIGGAINRASDRRARADQWEYMESKGLTATEIAGAGGASVGSSGVGNVLGNQEAALEQQRRQLEFQSSERDKDRALQMRAQDMGLAQAELTSGVGYQANALRERELNEVTLPQARNDLITTSPEFRLRALQMQMGPDNFFVEAIAQRFGVKLSDASFANMSDATWRRFVNEVQVFQSQAAREAAGAASTVRQSGSGLRDGVRSLGAALGGLNPLRSENWPSLGNGSPGVGDRGRPTGRGY